MGAGQAGCGLGLVVRDGAQRAFQDRGGMVLMADQDQAGPGVVT
ncbi:hypothetical protein [Streptomyces finlayi]|nr:hypothetical protein [Streptomyces finlayi]